MSEWPEVALTDIYDISSGLSKPADSFGSGYPFLSFKEVFGNYFLPDELEQLVESTKKERLKGSIKRGDVFLTRTSETMHELGMSSVSLKDYYNATFNGFTKRLRPKEESQHEVHPEFIGYCLRSPNFRRGMLAFSTMSTRASLNNDMISRLVIKLPPIQVQKNIAKILKGLDDKIELNRQTNQTLEQIAQSMFKSWFVDFEPTRAKIAAKEAGQDPERAAMAAISGKPIEALDQLTQEQQQQLKTTAALFPDSLIDSELGEIPKGWEVKPLSKMVELIGGGTPKKSQSDYWDGDIPWFSVKDAPPDGDVFVIDTELKITDTGLKKSSTKLLPEGVTIISARGTVGRLALVGIPTAMNQSCYGVKGVAGIGAYLNYFNIKEAVTTLQQNTHGAVFDTITRDTFDTVFLVDSSEDLKRVFESIVTESFMKIKNNLFESKSLSLLRDILLPKLLSGGLPIEYKGKVS